jgi:hypothetical protein
MQRQILALARVEFTVTHDFLRKWISAAGRRVGRSLW